MHNIHHCIYNNNCIYAQDARDCYVKLTKLKDENKKLRYENETLLSENNDLKRKLDEIDKSESSFDLDYLSFANTPDLNFNSQNELKYLED